MKLYFKQRIFSWFDSYDIFDEYGETVYTIKGQFSFGHAFIMYDRNDNEIARVNQRIMTFLPKYEVFIGDALYGTIKKELTLFKPVYTFDRLGWSMNGDILQWDFDILDQNNEVIGHASKQLLKLTDTYEIDVYDSHNALPALLFVLTVDAVKCSDG